MFSFGHIVVLAVVLLVVFGPQELPRIMRQLGRGLAKLRRMSIDLRKQSGIDEIIRQEGLQEELEVLRQLRAMSGTGVIDSLLRDAARPRAATATRPAPPELAEPVEQEAESFARIDLDGAPPDRAAEYPEIGCDAYGASYPKDAADPPGGQASDGETRPSPASEGEPSDKTDDSSKITDEAQARPGAVTT